MIIYGDLGTGSLGSFSTNLLTKMANDGLFDGVLHIGDIAYDMHE